ncbi:hypothetical protein PFLUV_G00053190 [Perca fluviatilis]|uniref:Uncharacterized protein n=1 Tax=Perca fluviatilis TaxID=8168 RepID=A0A6A5FC64_PERFL|nr:hypothetical protein PFLUV_G00053190 [Perca fluviatilis]
MIDTIDRPGKAFAAGTYAGAGKLEDLSDDEIGVYAGAGVGHARAEWRLCDAEAKGPNASAGAEISRAAGVRAIAKAELASASASAGPVKASRSVSRHWHRCWSFRCRGKGAGNWLLHRSYYGRFSVWHWD